jgi:hypothetical protein
MERADIFFRLPAYAAVKNIVYGLADGKVNPNLKVASLVQLTSSRPNSAESQNVQVKKRAADVLIFGGNQSKETNLMKHLRQIGISLLAMGVMTSFAVAAEKQDATLRLSFKSVAVGVGFSSGSGALTYKGKGYPVKVKGLSVGKVGVTSSSAYGEVFNLKHLQDFNGHYDVGGAGTRGVTVGAGKSGTLMTNQAGVIVRISSTQQGVSVNATGGGVDMQLQR